MVAREFYRQGKQVESRLPIVGKVRLGYRDPKKNNAPVATPYFVLTDAPQLVERFGERPTEIGPVWLPTEDESAVANRMLRYYTTTYQLTCWGDGQHATRKVDKEILDKTGEPTPASHTTKEARMVTLRCPCNLLESGQCKESMYFRFAIPDVEGIGVFQLATRSRNSIDNIFSCLDMIRAASVSTEYPRGRISGIPLRVSLRETEVVTIGDSKVRGGKKKVYLVFLEPWEQVSLNEFQRQLAGRPPMMALAEPEEGAAEEDDIEDAEFTEVGPVSPPAPDPAPEQPAASAPPSDDAPPPKGDAAAGAAITNNTVLDFAKKQGYRVNQVPAMLGTKEHPITLPVFLDAGGTRQDALAKIREYTMIDKGSVEE